MAVHRRDIVTRAEVPQLDQAVRATGQQLHAARGKCHLQDRVGVALKGAEAAPIRQGPDADRGIARARGQHLVHRRKLHTPHAALVSTQDTYLAARGCIPKLFKQDGEQEIMGG